MLTTLSSRFHRPFWPVTFISGGLALLTLVVLLVVYGQTRQWQYLALAGIVAMISLAHGLAGWLASRRDRFDLGIWLIAAAQILSAVVAPLFMADYWLIGLFLLAAVPIEVGAADQLRRMPLFAVFSLLGAAGMVAIDLLALPTRLTILTDLPGATFLAISFLILHLAGLTLLLWRLRLRPQASHHTRLDLATQQSLVFTGISAISIVVVTGVLIAQIRASQIEQVGQNFQTLAEINAERVGNSLEQQIAALLSLGRRETVLLEGLTAANAEYPESVVEIRQLLQEQEQRWQTSPENSDFILQYRSNPQTIELSKFRGADLLHNNVFLTDRRGGLVAAQGEKPAKFFYGDEAWWQTAWNNSQGGVYLGQLTIDPTTRIASIFIAVNVLNPQTNQTVGVLASTYQLRSVQRDISVASNQVTGEVALLSADGIVIAGPDEAAIGQPVGPSLLTSGQRNEQQLTEPGWLLGTDGQGEPVVLAHSLLNTSSGINLDPLRALGWQVVVSDTQVNALAGVTRSTKVATLVGLLAMALGVLAATATARVITRPIEALTTTAAAMSGGNLEQQAEPVGPVELVTLAEAFNTLTARLRSLINSLQDQVAQRTAQLEARVEQLATLNRITQTVASVRDLQAALEIVAREMVQLFKGRNSGIALLNAAQTELIVVAEYSRDPTEVNVVGTLIPLAGNPSSAHVVKTGRSIVVPQAQINPLTEPIHELMLMRQIQCLLIVPLLARGEVIGTIGVATDEPNREFTSTEVTLAETVAGQIAGAIENARLFSEMEKAKEVAEAANEAKSAFLANVSHELRTPLTSVLGFAKIIQKRLVEVIFPKVQVNSESAEDGKTQRALRQVKENIGIIVSEGERLTTLINNVLDLAKIEAGKVEWQMQPLAVAEIIERAIAATSALFEQKSLKLIKDVADNLPQVVGDYDRLIQVVINLISNAVKFTDHGSVTCQVRQVNGEIIISVTDTGIGIAEADQPKVFEKFIQVGNTLIDKPQGTGLGLTICKQIVEHHGGHIWLESKLGQGSTFSFTLSISTQERVLIAEEPPQPASAHL